MFFFKDPTRKLLLSKDTFTKHFDCRRKDEEKSTTQKVPRLGDQYELGDEVPGLPRTFHCTHKASMGARTLKAFPREDEESFWDERSILKFMSNPAFPRFFESFEDNNNLFLISEEIGQMYNLMDGIQKVAAKKKYSEKDVVDLVRLCLKSLKYCHELRVTGEDGEEKWISISHGAINPKNIMVSLKEGGAEDVIDEFMLVNWEHAAIHSTWKDQVGNSVRGRKMEAESLRVDTKEFDSDSDSDWYLSSSDEESDEEEGEAKEEKPKRSFFLAPEFYEEGATPKGDIYALGVLAYYLVMGKFPFKKPPKCDVYMPTTARVKKINFEGMNFPDLASFIKVALDMNPENRPSATEALDSKAYDLSAIYSKKEKDDDMDLQINGDVVSRLRVAHKQHKLQDAVTYYIANFLSFESGDEMIKLATTFTEMDQNCDGVLSKDELAESLGAANIHLKSEDLDKMIEKMDLNKDGKVELNEFLASAADTANITSEKKLRAAFNSFDISNTGFITADDIKIIFSSTGSSADKVLSTKAAKAMISKADVRGNGKISYNEFRAMMLDPRGMKIKKGKKKREDKKNAHEQSPEHKPSAWGEAEHNSELALEFARKMEFERAQRQAGYRFS